MFRSSTRATGITAILAFVAMLVTLARPAPLAAHPPVSVVVTPDGRVFFSDLNRIWVLEPDGTFRVALAGVHAHELRRDATGRVCGDDVQNVGDDYRFRFWCLAADGTVDNVLDWTEGHPNVLGWKLTEPAAGAKSAGDAARYWAIGEGGVLRLTDGDGRGDVVAALGGGEIGPSWVVADGEGAIVVRGGSVLRVAVDGETEVLADDLITRTEEFGFLHDRHALMKPWRDTDGRLYVPVFAGQRVLRLDRGASGRATSPPETVFRSEGSWSPVGGAGLADGTTWLLEWSASNQPRLRRIGPDGDERVFGPPG